MNTRAFQSFQRSMRSLERQYLADIRREFKTTRRLLLAEAVDRGIGDLAFYLDDYLDMLKAKIKGVGYQYAPEIERLGVIFTDRQVRDLRRVGVGVPRAGEVRPDADPRSNIDQVLLGEPAWVDQYRGLVLGTANQLVTADPSTASRRLFGANVAEGRATASRIAENKAIVGSSIQFWGAGNSGLIGMYDQIAVVERQVRKQVVATIDERTTQCCLMAHGQIVDFDQPFQLSGTPRFADQMDYAPFHWNCRTSIVLHHPEVEQLGVSTPEMRSAARAELEARQDGSRVEIHPSHATSGR